jgi:SAM-dependent methyltransferase
LGCGDGRHAALLAPRVKAVVGLDHQQLPLQYARLLLADSHVALSRGDGARLPLRSGQFGGVVCLDVVEHLPQAKASLLLGEIRRVLKAGGWALISTPNRQSLYNRIWGHRLSQKHYFEYSLDELCAAVTDAGLQVEARSGIYLPPLFLRPYLEHYASVFPVKHVFRWLIGAGAWMPQWSETILVLARAVT